MVYLQAVAMRMIDVIVQASTSARRRRLAFQPTAVAVAKEGPGLFHPHFGGNCANTFKTALLR